MRRRDFGLTVGKVNAAAGDHELHCRRKPFPLKGFLQFDVAA
jgi:hypothetical protein